MLRSVTCLLLSLMLLAAVAEACINEYDTPVQRSTPRNSQRGVPQSYPIDKEHYREQIEKLGPLVQDTPNYKDVSDLAVAHLYLGELDRAIGLLEQAEQMQAGEYTIASNLGTAFELAGRNEAALQWIEEGLRRDPKSHDGSEWVHANLLKAKIAMAADPDWLSSSANSVSGLYFGDAAKPEFDKTLSAGNLPASMEDIRNHLRHQLVERRRFIPGTDPIVAALMFDLANATALTVTAEAALPIYKAALKLEYHNSALIQKRIMEIMQLRQSNSDSSKEVGPRKWLPYTLLAFGTLVITACLVGWWMFRR